jgi:hypothetical protein
MWPFAPENLRLGLRLADALRRVRKVMTSRHSVVAAAVFLPITWNPQRV